MAAASNGHNQLQRGETAIRELQNCKSKAGRKLFHETWVLPGTQKEKGKCFFLDIFIMTLNKHKLKLVRRDTKAFIMLEFEQVNQILLDDSSAWEPSKSEN